MRTRTQLHHTHAETFHAEKVGRLGLSWECTSSQSFGRIRHIVHVVKYTLCLYFLTHSTVFVYRCVLTVFMDFTFVIGSQNASTITMIYNSMFVCGVRFVKMIIIEFEYIVFGPFDLSQEIINRCIWCRDASAIKSKIHMPVNSATTNRTIDIHLGYNVPIIISKPIRVGQWICAARIQFVWFYLTENNANSIESFFSFFSVHVSP